MELKTISKEQLINNILNKIEYFESKHDFRASEIAAKLYIALSNLLSTKDDGKVQAKEAV